MKDFVHSR